MTERPEKTTEGPCELDEAQPDGPALDLQRLVLDHYQAVYRYAYRLTGRQADAEDIAQQTFLVAQRKLHQVRDLQKADRWLFAVLRSCYLKSRRRRRPAAAANLELNVDQVPDRIREDDIDRELLQQSLDKLPDDAKVVLMLFYFEQLSYKEIAEQLGIAMGTVMSRLARAKSRLRELLLAPGSKERGDSRRAERMHSLGSGP